MNDPEASGGSAPEGATAPLLGVALFGGLLAAGVALVLFVWLGQAVRVGATAGLDERLRDLLHAYA